MVSEWVKPNPGHIHEPDNLFKIAYGGTDQAFERSFPSAQVDDGGGVALALNGRSLSLQSHSKLSVRARESRTCHSLPSCNERDL
ncbi:hypothetical protein CROQUDRAFT_99582 [Cronartium quercuum f. sp. fusiforme G11]|uniref:Uncharacterized protein n=1 Tax=Cronartium quercuum f. sp. fusiforme G11 TaxID=708437 RepID=A0A9P6T6G3_9BASI|nr:hypothetical protein CROQUDRAFT_99582 [Cronartium quercuum f. sp. fusiforme G11]